MVCVSIETALLFVADYPEHNVLRIDPRTKAITVFAHQPKMNQPNDLAITSDGVLYASDPNWKNGTGQIWRIDRDGSTHLVAADMGTTNGIDVSPGGKTLYVNESNQRNVWAFQIKETGDLTEKKLIKQFPDHGFDGMRCDIDGNLYITRHGKGTVVVMTPLRRYPARNRRPWIPPQQSLLRRFGWLHRLCH
jgi:gluconolactonase